jgi:hypothetical protein
MLHFLIMLIEWVAGFAMMFLGLSYSAPVDCAAAIHIVPVHYVESVELSETQDVDCASFEAEDADDARVFRI